MTTPEDVLQFWFGTTDLGAEMEKKEIWFRSTPEFDAEINDKFLQTWQDGADGKLDHWMDAPDSCAALIITLDQFPRNLFRGQGKAFSTDEKARLAARLIQDQGWDEKFSVTVQGFCNLPFMHSEELADQELGVALTLKRGPDERTIKAAEGHRDAIKRFGRFPHRNEAIGRQNTPAETEYLKDPPTWGKTAAEVAEMEAKKAAE